MRIHSSGFLGEISQMLAAQFLNMYRIVKYRYREDVRKFCSITNICSELWELLGVEGEAVSMAGVLRCQTPR